jgi:hypothetical protein
VKFDPPTHYSTPQRLVVLNANPAAGACSHFGEKRPPDGGKTKEFQFSRDGLTCVDRHELHGDPVIFYSAR